MRFSPKKSSDDPTADPAETTALAEVPHEATLAPGPTPRKVAPSLFPLFTPKSHLEGSISLFNELKYEDQRTSPYATREQERFVAGYEAWYADVVHWDENDARIDVAMREMRRRRDLLELDEYKAWLRSAVETMLYRKRLSFGRREVVQWGSYVNELAFHAYYPEETIAAALTTEEHSTPNLLELAGRLVSHNRKEYGTTTIAIDAARDAEGGFGQTGVGKSRKTLRLASLVAPKERPFHVMRDVVYKFDKEAFNRLIFEDRREFRAAIVDEAEKFFERRRSTSSLVMNAGHEVMAKRSLRQYDFFVLPSIWILDERLIFGLIQMRFKVVRKGEVEVYVNNGQGDKKEDRWGYRLSTIALPDVPSEIGKIYDRTKEAVGKWGSFSGALKNDGELARICTNIDAMLNLRVASLSKSGGPAAEGSKYAGGPVAGPDSTEVLPQEP